MSLPYDEYGFNPLMTKTETTQSGPISADSQFSDGDIPGGKVSSGPNLSTFGFPDNFDSTHPFTLPYYIDSSAKVTRATLSLFFQPFRAYETAASSGGGSTSGSSSSSTTSSGGGTTVTSVSATQTSTATTTDTSGQTSHQHGAVSKRRSGGWLAEDNEVRVRSLGTTDTQGREKAQLVVANTGWTTDWNLAVGFTETGHSHNVSITNPGHSHDVAVPNHTHGMDHTHSTPDHTHGITYGIYEGAYPTVVSISIDGVDVTSALSGPWNPTAGSANFLDMDITNYTSKTGSHVILLTTTGMGRCIPMLIIKSVLGSKS